MAVKDSDKCKTESNLRILPIPRGTKKHTGREGGPNLKLIDTTRLPGKP